MTKDLKICKYQVSDRSIWDAFIQRARNGLFWFLRDYLEHYGERIQDHSLMFLNGNGEVIGALPANRDGNTLRSHGGLPFGGLILSREAGFEEISAMLDLLAEHMRGAGLDRFVFTNMPAAYQQIQGDEVECLLQERGARSAGTRLTSMLALNGDGLPDLLKTSEWKKIRYSMRRYPLELSETEDAGEIWPALERFLQCRFGRSPVHSLAQINRLKTAFPANIRFVAARKNGRLTGGQVVFVFDKVARVQTYFRLEENQGDCFSMRLDLFAMEVLGGKCRTWDLGTSYDPDTGGLKTSLYWYKERLGARGVAIRGWEWDV